MKEDNRYQYNPDISWKDEHVGYVRAVGKSVG